MFIPTNDFYSLQIVNDDFPYANDALSACGGAETLQRRPCGCCSGSTRKCLSVISVTTNHLTNHQRGGRNPENEQEASLFTSIYYI